MSTFVWTDEAVRTALGLRRDLAEPGVSFTRIWTDSRSVAPGDLYVALVGERFDGHDFVADAFARGALGAVVAGPVAGDDAARLYPVADTLAALGELAAFRRAALQVPVVGVTGSSGKTTTKDLIAGALGSVQKVHATRANLNNRVGLPLTLLAVPDDAQAVVLELGTNEPGEIGALARIARPEVAVITTVGESHLEGLESVEGVLEEKLDLLRYRAESGTCIVGDEPAFLARAAREICPSLRVAGWSADADEDLRPATVEMDHWGAFTFAWREVSVALQLPGQHAVTDALLALAVADTLGVSPRDAARGIATVSPRSMRGEWRRIGDLSVLVDCYNANPQSVRASLDVLEAQPGGRKVVVLGSMLELGAASPRLHQEVLADTLSRDVGLVVATGAFAEAATAAGMTDARVRDRILAAPTWQEAYPLLRERLYGDEVILLKASRGVALEGMLDLLEADPPQPQPAGNGVGGAGEEV
ncbi:MAG: UDP-N-acetylmuramoyl-tripeptide--D-alanyl-D-alanine ligase [Gemmatimonadota bacterium]